MRRFLLLFAAVFLSLAAVAESSYTIVFTTSTNNDGGSVSTEVSDYIATESQTYVSAITSNTKAYPASTYGIKLNASKGGAVFTMSLAEVAKVKVTKIVASARLYGSDKEPTISINGKAEQKITSTSFSDYTFEFDGTEVITEITITGSPNNSKRFYVQSLTVYYDDSVEDPTDCGLSFKETAKTITYGTEYTLPTLSNPNNVNVTWSTDDVTVASFGTENNLQIHKAGTTTITATLADEGTEYTQNTSASYTLTIEKGTPEFAYAESTYDYVMKTGGEGFIAPTLNNPGGLVVTYSSDNSEVATVNETTGVITPVTRGTAVITATGAANDLWNGATATLTINITKNIPTLTFSNTEVSKFVDEIADYKGETLTVTPADLEVSYSVDKAEVASINETTGELTFTGATGTVTVTATTTETVVYESKTATYTVTVSKRDSKLAFDDAEIEKYDTESYDGQVAKSTIEEGLGEGFTVTYASDNDAVATVVANTGAVTLTGAVGTAVITATASGNTYYNEATASYTITVSKQYIFDDTYAVLVSDVNDLHEGDVIAIGHWSKTQSVAMTNSTSNDYFVAETATYSDDHKELTLTKTILLLQLEKVTVDETERWGLRTLNFDGEQGYIGGSAKGKLTVSTTVDAAHSATIDIGENSLTKILFTNDFELRCNTSTKPIRFAAYAGTVEPVYIYKLVTPEFKAEITIAVDETEGDANKITFSGLQESHGLAFDLSGYSVYLNGTYLGGYDETLSYLPFVPTGSFTISNGTYTYPVAVTWPDLAGITAKITNVKYWAWKDKEHAIPDVEDMWYLDAEYTVAADTEMELAVEFEFTGNASGEGHVKSVTGNTAYVEGIGWFSVTPKTDGEGKDYDLYKYVTAAAGDFKVTPKFPLFVKNALNDKFMAPEGTTRTVAISGNPLEVKVEEVAQQPVDSETGNVSGVESVVVDSEGAVEYYNLQGVRVEGALTPGIYIRRTATGTSKVAIR